MTKNELVSYAQQAEYIVNYSRSSILYVIWACCQEITSEFLVRSNLALSRQLHADSQINQCEFEFLIVPWPGANVLDFEISMRISEIMQLFQPLYNLMNHRNCEFNPHLLTNNLFIPVIKRWAFICHKDFSDAVVFIYRIAKHLRKSRILFISIYYQLTKIVNVLILSYPFQFCEDPDLPKKSFQVIFVLFDYDFGSKIWFFTKENLSL